MGIKVQNLNLELKIPSYENNGNKLVKIKSPTELEFVDNSELYSSINHSNINVGLKLSAYLDNLIISSGYFFDEEENKIYNFNKPTTLKILEEEIDSNNYGVYYIYSTNEFIYSTNTPEEKYRYIGKFNLVNHEIKSLFPIKDLSSSFENNFIIAEQLGTTGYRIYSDGYKEQWGNLVNPIFPVAFDNIPTNVTVGATNVTKTGMTIAAGYWQAEGY